MYSAMVGAWKKASRTILCSILAVIVGVFPVSQAFALDEDLLYVFSQSNILFYDPSATNCNNGAMPTGSQITWIGDSYSVGARAVIDEKFSGADYGESVNDANSYIQGSKWAAKDIDGNPAGTTILSNIISENKLRKYLVFALGTNGSWSDSDITTFDNIVKDENVNIVLVTSRTKSTSADYYVSSNNRLKNYANSHDNVIIADWYESYDDSYFSGADTIHPTANDGYSVWVGVIYDAIKNYVQSQAGDAGTATGDFDAIARAKNADKSYFNHSGNIDSAAWSDGDKDSMKRLLENYGDLAYQLGRAVGAPYVAILVQMRYEDPYSVCGKNNFWGNGCDPAHAYAGGATIQGENLGEGFQQYGKTLSSSWYDPVRGITDPEQYLRTIGPLWVQGDPNGAGYGSIDGMVRSIKALQEYIESSEGQAIVRQFGNYSSGICGGYAGIAEAAMSLSWDCTAQGGGCHSMYDPRPEYVEAMKKVDAYVPPCNSKGCPPEGASCDQFVATVIRFAGGDPDYPLWLGNESYGQYPYLASHPEMYVEIDHGGDLDKLESGDILVLPGAHTLMYVEIDGQAGQASASNGDRTGEHFYGIVLTESRGTYHVFRRINFNG